jgi:hypothetical protein
VLRSCTLPIGRWPSPRGSIASLAGLRSGSQARPPWPPQQGCHLRQWSSAGWNPDAVMSAWRGLELLAKGRRTRGTSDEFQTIKWCPPGSGPVAVQVTSRIEPSSSFERCTPRNNGPSIRTLPSRHQGGRYRPGDLTRSLLANPRTAVSRWRDSNEAASSMPFWAGSHCTAGLLLLYRRVIRRVTRRRIRTARGWTFREPDQGRRVCSGGYPPVSRTAHSSPIVQPGQRGSYRAQRSTWSRQQRCRFT